MIRRTPLAIVVSLSLIAHVAVGQSTRGGSPRNGVDVLEAMRSAYAGKWFSTLTFVQRTTVKRDSTTRVSTWYESLLSPDRLRIDIENPREGNGILYTADSLYVVRGGAVTRMAANGNVFLPFVQGVYTQPLDVTRRQLAPYNFDLNRLSVSRWRDRPVYVVGAKDSTDLTSPQFWVDRDRLVVVRMLVSFGGSSGAAVQDVLLDDYVPVGGGWLATKVSFQSTTGSQTEDYMNWKVDPPLPRDFFTVEHWKDFPHWAAPEAAIRAELDSTAAGWNRGDLGRYLATYVDTATTMGATGLVRGRAGIEAQMKSGFWKAGPPAQKLHYENVEIRMLGSDNALVTGEFVLQGAGRPNRTGWFTTIWTKTREGWRMVHDHS
jgi:ketosteroid isomerase-like protein